jgi:hypothetical protein
MIFKPSGLCGRYEFSLGDVLDDFFTSLRGKLLKKQTPVEAEGKCAP